MGGIMLQCWTVALNAAAAGRGIAAPVQAKDQSCRRSHQPRNPPSLRPAEFSPSPAHCYEVFFGARVAIQPQTTSAIMTARKIPSSAMLFLRRPAWGGIKSCAVREEPSSIFDAASCFDDGASRGRGSGSAPGIFEFRRRSARAKPQFPRSARGYETVSPSCTHVKQ